MANQATVIVVKNLAEPGSGGQDAFTKATTFFYFPHGLLAMSIATTFIPEMARAVARRDRNAFVERTAFGLRLVGLLTFPAAFAFLVMSRPIIGALLQHGEFSNNAAITTSRALAGISLGLVGYSIYLFALRGFYAHQDTRTPFLINLVQNVLNIILAFALVRSYGVLGLGVAFAVSYVVGAVIALFVLRIKVHTFPVLDVLRSLARMLAAAAVMGAVLWLALKPVGDNDGFGAVLKISVGVVVGLLVYLGALTLLRVPEVNSLRSASQRFISNRNSSGQ
jgi:putative peptidoglycan lipid II flippase